MDVFDIGWRRASRLRSVRHRYFSSIQRLLVLAATAWIACWACAPPTSLPAPVPLAKGDGFELGGGATGGLLFEKDCRTTRDESGATVSYTCDPVLGGTGDIQQWGMVAVNDRRTLGWVVNGGLGSRTYNGDPGVSAGFVTRLDLAEAPHRLIGVQAELGWLWVSVGAPVSFQVRDDIWVYTHPSIGLRNPGYLRLPFGVGVGLNERLRLDIEAGASAPFEDAIATS